MSPLTMRSYHVGWSHGHAGSCWLSSSVAGYQTPTGGRKGGLLGGLGAADYVCVVAAVTSWRTLRATGDLDSRKSRSRSRGLAIILVGIALSSMGDFLAVTALALHLHDIGRPPLAVSALMLAGLLPLVLFGPVAGAAVDRFETRSLLRIVLAVQAALALALAFSDALWGLLALVFALGVGTAIAQTGIVALLPTLTSADRVVSVNGRFEAFRAIGTTLGPPLGGILAAGWGARGALVVDSVTFAVLCGSLWLVPARRTTMTTAPVAPAAGPGHQTPLALAAGIQYIARDPQLRLAVVVLTTTTFFLAGVNVVEVYFARDILRTGGLGYGALVGAWGVGMVLGALGTARWVPATRLIVIPAAIGLLAGTAIIIPALLPLLPIALTGWLLAGVTNGAYHVALRSLLHRRAPAELHGRVFGAQFAAYNAAKVASIVTAGPIIGVLEPRATLLAMGIATLATGLVGVGWLTAYLHSGGRLADPS